MLIYLQTIGPDSEMERFARIYKVYKGILFHIAMEIFHKREDAEDVVQQTFFRIIQNMDKLDRVDDPKTRSYVVSVCKSCAIDLLRKRKKEISVEDIDEKILPQYTNDDLLSDAFRRLRPQYRELLLLRYHLGYGTSEIARMYRVNYETVRKRLQYAKKQLQKLLEEEGEENGEDPAD